MRKHWDGTDNFGFTSHNFSQLIQKASPSCVKPLFTMKYKTSLPATT